MAAWVIQMSSKSKLWYCRFNLLIAKQSYGSHSGFGWIGSHSYRQQIGQVKSRDADSVTLRRRNIQ